MGRTKADSIGQPHAGGFHRRIRLYPQADRIVAGLEDNLHRFIMELRHDGACVTDLRMETVRYPWTTCAEAPAALRGQAIGKALADLADLNIFQHCTHLFELAVLCAAHAGDTAPTQFDLHVAEWVDGRTRVRLHVDGSPVLDLAVDGRVVATPGDWFGRDLLQPASWRGELDAAAAETAMLVSRALYVSLGRMAPVVERASERGPGIVGVCFSYQAQRVDEAVRIPHARREFAGSSLVPLEDFGPPFGG